MLARLGVIGLLACGCFSPTFDHPSCGRGGECPDGERCFNGLCELPNGCPANYDLYAQGSWYRLLSEPLATWQHSDTCLGDQPGRTRLVVFETLEEVVAVDKIIDWQIVPYGVYAGGVQQRDATKLDDGWIRFDGGPWVGEWNPGEPNDTACGAAPAEDGDEQFAELQRTRFNDSSGAALRGGLCECDDGSGMAPTAIQEIASYRLTAIPGCPMRLADN